MPSSDILISFTFIIFLHLLAKRNPLHNCAGKSARVMQLKQMLTKCTQILVTKDIAPSKEAEKPKESFLYHENPQYSSDMSPMIDTEKPSQLFFFYNCEFFNAESSVRRHMSITHISFQCEYCNFRNMISDIMKTHIQSNRKNVPSKHKIYSLFKYPSQEKRL